MTVLKAFKSATFGLAIWYGVLFSSSALLLVGFLFWETIVFMDRQVDSILRSEMVSLVRGRTAPDPERLAEEIRRRIPVIDEEGLYYAVLDPAGELLAGNLRNFDALSTSSDGSFDLRLPSPERNLERVVQGRVHVLPDGYRVLVALDVQDEQHLQNLIAETLITGIVLMLLLSVAGAFLFRRAVVARLQKVNRTCEDIMEGDLSQRVPRSGADDEFDHLSENINRMLDEIQYLMESKRNMSTTIAHDLRHPLTRLKTLIETILAPSTDTQETRSVVTRVAVELDNVIELFNALLRISKVEAGSGRENFQQFRLDIAVADACDLYSPLAEEKAIVLHLDRAEAVEIDGDIHLLSQAIANLLDNAVKYTPSGGRIDVAARLDGGMAELRVADTGPGVPPEVRPLITRRFFRMDKSRTTPGHGLGLTLVAAVAKLHRGQLILGDNEPGLDVRIRVPLGHAERRGFAIT